jgi:hypothetical protein
MAELMSSYKDKFKGRPAAILGGGPSLPNDMDKLPKGCLLIAVNFHYHLWSGKHPDFMVYNDHLEADDILRAEVEATEAIRVSPYGPTSDIEFDVEHWSGFYSSNTAAWFALWMGCNPVILCGMDCYQGAEVYCHEFQRDVGPAHYPLEAHLRPWIEEGLKLLPHVERVKVMSGPLASIFGAFQP